MAVTALPYVRPVVIEALGDDFALVSGQWLQGARMAAHLKQAHSLWVFAVARDEDIPPLAQSLAVGDGDWIVGITPGKAPGWPKGDRDVLRQLAEADFPADATVGLLLAIDAPDCGHCGADCEGCHATNPQDKASYARAQTTLDKDITDREEPTA